MNREESTAPPQKRSKTKNLNDEEEKINRLVDSLYKEAEANNQHMATIRERLLAKDDEPDSIYTSIGRNIKKMSSFTQGWMEDKFLQLYQEAKRVEENYSRGQGSTSGYMYSGPSSYPPLNTSFNFPAPLNVPASAPGSVSPWTTEETNLWDMDFGKAVNLYNQH